MKVQFKTPALKEDAEKKGILASLGLTGSISTRREPFVCGMLMAAHALTLDVLCCRNMYLFDVSGHIKLYPTTSSILDEWCPWRLAQYERRREHMLSDLGRSIDKLSNTYRFITAVVKRDIDIAAFDSGALVARLAADGYAMIDDSYEYLLRIRVDTLTRDRAAKAAADLEKERAAQAALRAKRARDLWAEDLETIAPLLA